MPRFPSAAGFHYRYVRRRWHVLFAIVDTAGWLGVLIVEAVRGTVATASRLVRSTACRAWRQEAQTLPLGSTNGAHDPTRSILVVQLDHLGDAVMTTGLLRALRARYPRASLEVLAGEWNREFFEALPEVDRVHITQVSRFARRGSAGWLPALLAWGWRLRQRKFDLGIDVRGDFPIALLLWLAGARRRVGWDCGGGGFLLTDSPAFVPGRHEVLSRQALLDVLDIPPPSATASLPAAWAPEFAAPPEARKWIARELAWRDSSRPLVLLHVGAGTQAKRWPADRWRELIGRLRVEQQAQIVIVGGRDDVAAAREVTGEFPSSDVQDWTGRLSIPQLAAALEQAEVLVGADSGPAHLAAAVGTPVVVLFSGANRHEQWRPWGEQVRVVRQPTSCSPCFQPHCPLADHPCMTGLKVSAVLTAIRKFLVAEPVSSILTLTAAHGTTGRKEAA